MKTPLVYSAVVQQGLIRLKKNKYTLRDVNETILDSLFRSRITLSEAEAVFVVKCSATFHGSDYSKAVTKL